MADIATFTTNALDHRLGAISEPAIAAPRENGPT